MNIRQALDITFFGMGIVFLVLVIDFVSILVIGMFRKQAQKDPGVEHQGFEPESEDEGKRFAPAEPIAAEGKTLSLIAPHSGGVPGLEVSAAIVAAVCAWEAEEDRVQPGFSLDHNLSIISNEALT